MDSDTATESNLLQDHDHSWTEWMIDCERCWTVFQKMYCKTSTNFLCFGECLSLTLEASVLMGKNYSDNLPSIKKTGENLTLKQMFEISEKLILEQSDEIFGVSQIGWESSPWKQLSLVNDEEVINLLHAKVFVFSDSVLCLGKVNQDPTSNTAWEQQLDWFKSSSQYRTLDTIDGEPMEFEWNIFPGFTTLQFCNKVQEFLSKWANQNNSKDELSSCRCSTTSHGGSKDNEQECELSAKLVSIYARRFSPGRWSFLGPGSERKWYSTHESKPQGEWDRVEEQMMKNFSESGHPVFRATSPLSRGTLKIKGGGKLSIHFCADEGTIETFFRTLTDVLGCGRVSWWGSRRTLV